MTNDGSLSTSGATILTGANTIGLMALLAYTVRNISEINIYLDELRDEYKALKISYIDSTKRTHQAITKMSERLNSFETRKQSHPRHITPEPKIVEVPEDINSQVDDVTAAIDELMKR